MILTNMIHLLFSILAIIFAISLLIGFHELGHFLVARFFKIKVLRFSIGFGKPLFRHRDKKGTEYVLALIPLGGYVRMLDEREGEVLAHEKHLAFNRQTFLKKILVVLAGPLFNILLAAAVYWWMFILGVTASIPIIGSIEANSIAAKGGLKPQQEIIALDEYITLDWSKVAMQLMTHIGNQDTILFTVRDKDSLSKHDLKLNLENWELDSLQPKPLESLGIKQYVPFQEVIIDQLIADAPAEKAGLKPGDRIVKINNEKVKNILTVVNTVSSHRDQKIVISVLRQGKIYHINAIPKPHYRYWGEGYMGVQFVPPKFPPQLLREQKYSVFKSFWMAWREVKDMTHFNLIIIKKLLTGALSIKSLGGPLSLFKGAAVSADIGTSYYLNFIGMISVGLAVINLLPIPGLDGGHILYFLIESIIRRPIPIAIQLLVFRIGVILLLLLIMQAMLNDLMRL